MSREFFQLQREAALGNPDALVFLLSFTAYAHAIDDLIDEESSPESLLTMCVQANEMYSTPFWLAHSARLGGVIGLIANAYADSIAWEQHSEDWKRRMADVLRQAGNEMLMAVAQIVGGWQHMRRISMRVRECAYHEQHEES